MAIIVRQLMGILFDEFIHALKRDGALYRNEFNLEGRHVGNLELVEETEEILVVAIDRHQSADGCPTKGRRSAFYYESREEYIYRGGGDLSSRTIEGPKLVVDSDAWLERAVDEIDEMGVLNEDMSITEILEELKQFNFETAKGFFLDAGVTFKDLLDELARRIYENHQRLR